MSFLVYRSSAGSGKTFKLVKKYMVLIINEPNKFRNVLAVTFTNKAANEMKERILGHLKVLSSDKPDKNSVTIKYLLPDLIKSTGLSSQEIKRRAMISLKLILHNYSDFAICTIDSFIHRIVRTFAHDLHLPLNFDVELDADILISQAVDLLISKVGADKKLTKVLISFVLSSIEEERTWNIENELKDFSQNLIKEDSGLYIEQLKNLSLDDFNKIKTKLWGFTSGFEEQIEKFASEAIELINSKDLDISCFYRGKSGIGNYFKRLSEKDIEKVVPNSYVLKTINEDKWYGGNASNTDKAKIDVIKDRLFSIFNKISNLAEKKFELYTLCRLIQRYLYSLAVLNEIDKLIEEIKEQSNVIHISEFNKKIAKIVLNEPIPFIYERMGEKYKHFLIDEFQDTSVLQWQNLLPLIDNSLASNNFNMIVGDSKQAIYRWRNGDTEQFIKLPERITKSKDIIQKERYENLKRHYAYEELKENFRSKAEIVSFNNYFFKIIRGLINLDYKSYFSEVTQLYDEKNTGGYIQISVLEKNNKRLFEEDNLKGILEIIKSLRIDGFKLSDIAILCRSNDEASKTARFLIKNEIDVISSESLLLGSSPDLNFIIAFIKFLLNPSEKINQVHILMYLYESNKLRAENHDYLFEYLMRANTENNQANQDVIHSEEMMKILKSNGLVFEIARLKSMPVYDLCEEIIRIFHLNDKENIFLEFFLEEAYKYMLKNKQGLTDYIDWWEERKNKSSVITSEGTDAVRIMTIHKAKGLEFPVVIYPFADQQLKSTRKNLWIELDDKDIFKGLKVANIPVNKKLENTSLADDYHTEMEKSFCDMINLLYVVMTRPTNRLYILTKQTSEKAGEKKSVSGIINYFLKESGLYNKDKNIYEFGTKSHYKRESIKEKHTIPVEPMISDNWQGKMILSMSAPEIWETEYPASAGEWGKLLHSIISKIDTFDDIKKVLEEYLIKGYLVKETYDEILKKIDQLINHPELNLYFGKNAEVKKEKEIIDEDGKIYRPDRFVTINSNNFLLDYKTSKPSKSHENQLRIYEKVLNKMGYKNIIKKLIYINDEINIFNIN